MRFFHELFHHVKRIFKPKGRGFFHKTPSGKYSPTVTRILSDAMLFNELPPSAGTESRRREFILEKLRDFGIYEPYQDDAGNIGALFPASQYTDKHVLLYTDIGTEQYSPIESIVRLTETHAWGMGISDESIGVAALLNFAEQMQSSAYEYKHNVICLFTDLSEDRGEFKGLEYFLRTFPGSISFGLYISSIHQGNGEPQPLGHCKLSVRVKTPEQEVLNHAGGPSSVAVLSHIAFQLGNIQWDRESKTVLNIARIDGGIGFGYFPSEGELELELFSLQSPILEMMRNTVVATVEKIGREMGASATVTILSRVPPGDAELNKPLLRVLKQVLQKLKIEEHTLSVPTKTTFLHSFRVPAITLGITRGKKGKQEEYVEIRPIEAGFQQIPLFLEQGIETIELGEP